MCISIFIYVHLLCICTSFRTVSSSNVYHRASTACFQLSFNSSFSMHEKIDVLSSLDLDIRIVMAFYVFHLFFRLQIYLEDDYFNVHFKFYDFMWTSEWTFDSSLILSFENLYIFYYLILIYLSKLIIKIIFRRVEIIFRDGLIITRPNLSNIGYKNNFIIV